MMSRSRSAFVAFFSMLAVAGSASAQRRGPVARPAPPPAAAFHPPMAPPPQFHPAQPVGEPFRPQTAPAQGFRPAEAPVGARPVGGFQPAPYGRPVGVAQGGGGFRPAAGAPVQGFRPVQANPAFPGARPAVTAYGRPPMGGYPGGVVVVRNRYPVYGGYAPLVVRYSYHPEYFAYVPGGIFFTQPDYLAMDSNIYLGQYRGFLDGVQQGLGVRVQNGELPPEAVTDAQDERNYVEQVIATDIASTGIITPDERGQLRELADGMVALNNYQPQPQGVAVDQGAYVQPDPNAQYQQYQAPPSVDPNAQYQQYQQYQPQQ